MNRTALLALLLPCLAALFLLAAGTDGSKEKLDDTGFESIFDGKTLEGWHVSGKSAHSNASKNKSGGRWVVEENAIVGSQDIPGNGGLIMTDKSYGDVEVVLEMRNDFGPDSGLLLRSTEDGKAYQALIDYHTGGSLMGVFGESLRPSFHVYNFEFLDSPEKIKVHDCPFALPISPEKWPDFWKHHQWNEFRVRIVGNPAKITTWIKGVKFMEWTDTMKRSPDKGGLALQVHGGGDFTKQFVRYRNIRVKRLDK